MAYEYLEQKLHQYNELRNKMNEVTTESYEADFSLRYIHNSTAIEGNTLTLIETKVLLEDRVSVGGKNLRELYEVDNHDKAFKYVKKCIANRKPLNESIVKDIHAILMESIMVGGVYRDVSVRISGARHTPPPPNEMYNQIKAFYQELSLKTVNPIELAAWTHAEFVKIHPFQDGNGRTSRLIMNYQLMSNGYLPISISKEERLKYYEALDEYAITGELKQFADIIASSEEYELDRYIGLVTQK